MNRIDLRNESACARGGADQYQWSRTPVEQKLVENPVEDPVENPAV
jgi:hypothetical protein